MAMAMSLVIVLSTKLRLIVLSIWLLISRLCVVSRRWNIKILFITMLFRYRWCNQRLFWFLLFVLLGEAKSIDEARPNAATNTCKESEENYQDDCHVWTFFLWRCTVVVFSTAIFTLSGVHELVLAVDHATDLSLVLDACRSIDVLWSEHVLVTIQIMIGQILVRIFWVECLR